MSTYLNRRTSAAVIQRPALATGLDGATYDAFPVDAYSPVPVV